MMKRKIESTIIAIIAIIMRVRFVYGAAWSATPACNYRSLLAGATQAIKCLAGRFRPRGPCADGYLQPES